MPDRFIQLQRYVFTFQREKKSRDFRDIARSKKPKTPKIIQPLERCGYVTKARVRTREPSRLFCTESFLSFWEKRVSQQPFFSLQTQRKSIFPPFFTCDMDAAVCMPRTFDLAFLMLLRSKNWRVRTTKALFDF